MSSHERGNPAGDADRVRQPDRRRLGGTWIVGAVVTFAAMAAATPGVAGPLASLLQVRDTVPRGADLRCLTRRPGDCLDEPVPRDEPHGANCATCHNLWDPAVPATVTRSCTAAGCHTEGAGAGTFHRTVHPESLADCVHCHKAHDFRVPESGNECSACHKGGGVDVEWMDASASHGLSAPAPFTHGDHGRVSCIRCHGTGDGHGTLAVTGLGDCRACHHSAPLANDCSACHASGPLAGRTLLVTRSLDIRIGSLDRPLRLLPFDHANHGTVTCGTCHTRGTDLRAAAGADCSTCHADHHEPTANCGTCHQPPATSAHDLDSHLGCTGAGCHDPAPVGIQDAPQTRNLCLACHRGKATHKPDRNCVDCHVLPTGTGR